MRSFLRLITDDDEVLFGTFTLLRENPFVVICLQSKRMADPHYPGGMMIEHREREFETELAMKTLGCGWIQWQHPDDRPDWDKVYTSVERLRDGRMTFDHVYAPAVEDLGGNEQHNYIGTIAADVFREVPITYYLTYTRDGKSTSENEVDFEPEWVAKKLHAMAIYKSQAAHPATRSHFIDNGLREYYA